MYLYLNEEITHCGGEVLYNKYHLFDLNSLPKKNPARKRAREDLYRLANYWIFDRLLEEDEIKDYSADSRWEYRDKQWVETVLITEEQRREEWKKGWW